MSLPAPTPLPSSGSGPTFLPSLTSTTAPGKVFATRSELQMHYKSDWHRYNLKRREAGLSMLNESDFTARLEAAVALRKEREGRDERSGMDHRKDKTQTKKEKKQNKQKGKQHKRQPAFAKKRDEQRSEENLNDENVADEGEDDNIVETVESEDDESMDEEQQPPDIDPCQSLFDDHTSSSPAANLSYMKSKYSFFLPDAEYCVDLEGFLGYCNEKIRWGNICLYCQKTYKGAEGTIKHMRDKQHCKVLYERGTDMEEYDVFYDFGEMNRRLLGDVDDEEEDGAERNDGAAMDEEGEDEEWEDVSGDEDDDEDDDASMKDEDDDDDLYSAYRDEIATRGFDITPLGELIFPDGRIVGHRGLARYYKQRFAPDRMERAAVRHAREAAGDRLYCGRVVNLRRLQGGEEGGGQADGADGASSALATMGRMSGSIPTGRNGKGVLVSAGAGGGSFTALSLYRYRAAVKKQRREDARGQRLQHRSRMNMNKMDKKGNTRSTGVVVSHNPR